MYDWPEIRTHTDRFWSEIRTELASHGVAAAEELTRGEDISAPWRMPDLLLGQTCGYPLVRGLAEPALAFARPSYDVEGCGEGTYRSCFLAGENGTLADFRGMRAAVNGWDSQSGFIALAHAIRPYAAADAPFFAAASVTGAHRASADAVARGDTDLCAMDAVAWALYQRIEPARAASLHVIGWSTEVPALPYVTAPGHAELAEMLCTALDRAARTLEGTCPALPIRVTPATRVDYAPIAAMAEAATEMAFAPQGAQQSP
ncbi:MAG: PhnD/SsuA/transferrin family substrate-binding protein [Pseudomonadota bacterium]